MDFLHKPIRYREEKYKLIQRDNINLSYKNKYGAESHKKILIL